MRKRLALAMTGAAVSMLAACTSASTHAASARAAPRSPAPAPTVRTAPMVGCVQQYDAWAKGPGKGVLAQLTAVGSAGNDVAARAALKKAKPAITKAGHYPVPVCADPKGYWTVLLMHLSAAAASTRSFQLDASLKGVPKISGELATELKHTAKNT